MKHIEKAKSLMELATRTDNPAEAATAALQFTKMVKKYDLLVSSSPNEESVCKKCKGAGWHVSIDSLFAGRCPACDGTGKIPGK